MGIIESIRNGATNLEQKNKNMSQISRLRRMIDDAKKERDGLIMSLGKMYYRDNVGNHRSKYDDEIRQITDLDETVKAMKAQVDKLRGIVRCSACGAELPAESRFCLKCGKKIEEIPEIQAEPAPNPVIRVYEPEDDDIICTAEEEAVQEKPKTTRKRGNKTKSEDGNVQE